MSDESERKPLGIPPFYWAKPPKQAKRPANGFANKEQKRFYFAVTAFKLAKVAAALAVALVIMGLV